MSGTTPLVEAPPIEPSSNGSSPAAAPVESRPASAGRSATGYRAGGSSIGILLINLGTPEAAEPKALRRYLKEFLSDPRVIENNSLLWKFVLNSIVLPLRSRRKARDYQQSGTTRKINRH